MDWEELLDPLSPIFKDTMQEQIRIVNLQDGLITAARKLTEESYPELSKAAPAVPKALNNAIISHAIKMSVDINNAISGQGKDDFFH